MPIEITCTNCLSVLRVADEHAGKSARCPQCSAVIPIPLTGASSPDIGIGSQSNPSSEASWDAGSKSASPYQPVASGQQHLSQHRGGIILALGIASLICCQLIGIAAIIMANEDLRQMDQGRMDPSGRGLTQAGKIIGIVSLIMFALGILCFIAQILFLGIAASV